MSPELTILPEPPAASPSTACPGLGAERRLLRTMGERQAQEAAASPVRKAVLTDKVSKHDRE